MRSIDNLSKRELAQLADDLLKELDHLEDVEHNLVVKPAEYHVGVTRDGVRHQFAFQTEDAMFDFIMRVTR